MCLFFFLVVVTMVFMTEVSHAWHDLGNDTDEELDQLTWRTMTHVSQGEKVQVTIVCTDKDPVTVGTSPLIG